MNSRPTVPPGSGQVIMDATQPREYDQLTMVNTYFLLKAYLLYISFPLYTVGIHLHGLWDYFPYFYFLH